MSSKVEKKKEPVGKTPPIQFRLGPDVLAKLDDLIASMGASNRAEVVRRLIHEAHRKAAKQ